MKFKINDVVYFRFAGGTFQGRVDELKESYTGDVKYTIEGTSYPGRYFAYEKDMMLCTEDVTADDFLKEIETRRTKTKK